LTDAQYGKILAATPDPSGKLDFIAVRDQNGNVTRQIRWYGFPRDVNGDGVIDLNVIPSGGALPSNKQPTGGFDVVPLVSVIRAAFGASAPAEPFEKVLPADIATDGFSSMQMTPAVVPAFPAKSGAYICAWDPTVPASVEPRPKLIRIIVGLDDPAGRLNSEQTFEYIFALP